MNVSKVSSNSMNFGSIKKSAVEKAIKQANGNPSELSKIKTAIEEQKGNPYNIEGLPSHEYYNYIVIKQGDHSGMCFMTLEEACRDANGSKQRDVWKKEAEMRRNQQKPQFDKLASELLDSCED